jgi:hypothetical protein
MVSELFRFPNAVSHDPEVEAWFSDSQDTMRLMAKPWFDLMRRCGPDVRELLHDGCPTACEGEAAFAYVNAFRAHVNIGFYFGAELPDPACLLEGSGKRMRHVKVRWGSGVNAAALSELIAVAHRDIRARLGSGG